LRVLSPNRRSTPLNGDVQFVRTGDFAQLPIEGVERWAVEAGTP
jgi:hypothetical protein